MNQNLYALLAGHFPRQPDAPCMILADGRVWTYGDVERASARIANLLVSLGLEPGDRVAALADGQIVAIGPMDDLLNSEHPWVKAYFHGKRSLMLHRNPD